MSFRGNQIAALIALALLGWALCGAIMFVGMAVTTLEVTLVVHALGAPAIFAAISWFYFARMRYTTPVATAMIFTSTVILVDFFLVALMINRSLEMFRSPLGTWIPFALIFLATWLSGLAIGKRGEAPTPPRPRDATDF